MPSAPACSTPRTSSCRPTCSWRRPRPRRRSLGTGYAQWVHSIRSGVGAIEYPTPDQARAARLPDDATASVADRLATRFVGDPAHVADRLETLRRVTGADELLVTTIAHDHDVRVRSYELLAAEWAARVVEGSPLWLRGRSLRVHVPTSHLSFDGWDVVRCAHIGCVCEKPTTPPRPRRSRGCRGTPQLLSSGRPSGFTSDVFTASFDRL